MNCAIARFSERLQVLLLATACRELLIRGLPEAGDSWPRISSMEVVDIADSSDCEGSETGSTCVPPAPRSKAHHGHAKVLLGPAIVPPVRRPATAGAPQCLGTFRQGV
jgi:hypothetical protein